jgi:plastocyanin
MSKLKFMPMSVQRTAHQIRPYRQRRALAAALALALTAMVPGARVALADDSTTQTAAAPAQISIDNFTFGPNVLTVKAGSTVTWINHDDIPHTILDKQRKVFRSKVLDTNDSYSFMFKEPGTYEYFCGLHPHMTGQIVVTP